jgi:hypothetical protein
MVIKLLNFTANIKTKNNNKKTAQKQKQTKDNNNKTDSKVNSPNEGVSF